MRTDGQTVMTKLIVAFRNFAIAPNKTETCHLGYAVTSGGMMKNPHAIYTYIHTYILD